MDSTLYQDDFYRWTREQARILRSLRVTDSRFDRNRVAEEIEDLGKSERDAVRSQVRRVLEHLLKLEYSPAAGPRFAWEATIIDARAVLSDKLTRSLRRDVKRHLDKLYADARRSAVVGLKEHGEPGAAAELPASCPYDLDRICEQDWYPDRQR
jgi:Domain of unknown function DUF29